jgi:DUF1365 family protein
MNALYVGNIEHRRFSPKENMFNYQVAYYFVDLEKAAKTFNIPFLFSFNSSGILSFWQKDYLSPQTVRESIKEMTGKDSRGPIKILTNISYFGFCFNPVSFYYCYAEDQETLEFIVSDITNTPWREKHRQVFEMEDQIKKDFNFLKGFHVSPFMPMNIDYAWIFKKPSDQLYVLMQNRPQNDSTIIFDSTLMLKRYELNARNVIGTFLKLPLVTFKTVLAIYYQAFKLWIKKVPFYTHPSKEKVYDNSTLT